MKSAHLEGALYHELSLRLPWLLVFRAAVATGLLLLTLSADLSNWQLRRMSPLLYAVVISTYLIVLVLGLLLRAYSQAAILAAVHLATVVMSANMVVHGTGGVRSAFSFLFLLAIIDGAIIGGRQIAIVVASACSLSYGALLVLQLYGLLPGVLDGIPRTSAFTSSFIVHLAAFYFVAFLSGHLASLWRHAHIAAAEAALHVREMQERHSIVLDSLPVGVVTLGLGESVDMVNPYAENLFGMDASELLGRRVPEPLASLFDDIRASGAHGRRRVYLSNRMTELSIRCSPLALMGSSQGGDVCSSGEVWVIEDRTQIATLEADLREKEKLASIGQLAASIAHELRNPLASISGAVELWHERTGESHDDRRLSVIALREVERLKRLVNDFLMFARTSAPQCEWIDVASLVRDTCELARRDSGSWQGIELLTVVPSHLMASVDPAQCQQILWNLLNNAVESGTSQVEVTVEEVLYDPTAAGDHANVSQNMLRVCVADRGCGFGDERGDRFVEPFYTTKELGTGLGLAVVNSLVQAHQGELELRNRPGGGAEVIIWVPLRRDSGAPMATRNQRVLRD